MSRKLDRILQYIASADMEDIYRILEAVIRKCDESVPDWETILLSLPREDQERREEYIKGIRGFLLDRDHSGIG